MAVGCGSTGQNAAQREPSMIPQHKFELAKEPPINAESRFAAGGLAESRGDWQRAITQYEESLKLRPDNVETIGRLSVCYAMMRQPEQAIHFGERAVQLSGGSPNAWNNLAQCQEYAEKLQDAEASYRQGIEKDPKNKLCRINLGLLLVRQGRVDEGREQMSAVLPPAEVHFNVASVFELQKKPAEAKAEYQRAIALDPKLTDAKKRLAKIE